MLQIDNIPGDSALLAGSLWGTYTHEGSYDQGMIAGDRLPADDLGRSLSIMDNYYPLVLRLPWLCGLGGQESIDNGYLIQGTKPFQGIGAAGAKRISFSAYIARLARLFSSQFTDFGDASTFGSSHNVSHYNLVGHAYAGSTSFLRRTPALVYDPQENAESLVEAVWINVEGEVPVFSEIYGSSRPRPSGAMALVLQDMERAWSDYHPLFPYHSHLMFDCDALSCKTVAYIYTPWFYSGGSRYIRRYAVRHVFNYTFVPAVFNGSYAYLGGIPQYRMRTDYVQMNHDIRSIDDHQLPDWYGTYSIPSIIGNWEGLGEFSGSYTTEVNAYLASRIGTGSSLVDLIGYGGIDPSTNQPVFIDSGPKSFYFFVRQSDSSLADLLLGSALASESALLTDLQALRANWLANLREAGDLLQILDTIKMVRQFRFDGLAPAVLRMLDIASSAELLKSFVLRPTTSDVEELAFKAQITLTRLKTLSGVRFARGELNYEFAAGEFAPFEGSCVKHRANIGYELDPDVILPGLIAADSLGLLPTLSRLWDMLPFSFALDWAVDFGSGFEALDGMVRLTIARVFASEHSVVLGYSFDESDMTEHNFSVVGSNHTSSNPMNGSIRAGYRSYWRWAQLGFPLLTPSRYGYVLQSGSPRLATVGALVWALL